jgi:hypothetical protein
MAVICLVLPLFCIQASADETINVSQYADNDALETAINDALNNPANSTVTVTGTKDDQDMMGDVSAVFRYAGQTLNWTAFAPNIALDINTAASSVNFHMNTGSLNVLIFQYVNEGVLHNYEVIGNSYINSHIYVGNRVTLYYAETITTNEGINGMGTWLLYGSPQQDPEIIDDPSDPEREPETNDIIELQRKMPNSPPGGFADKIIVIITDDKEFEKDGKNYYGIVDIKNFYSDEPREIPDEVFINGLRYLVGDTIYIVGAEDLEIIGYTETGVSYVFPAVENSDEIATFTAEGLPEGVVLSEDGVLSTETLPLTAGVYQFTVTVDNGLDTNTINVRLTIKEGYASDEELLLDLTRNDKEEQPEILDQLGGDDGTDRSGEDDGGREEIEPGYEVPEIWMNEELGLHYDPELEDFVGLFLDGRRLIENVDYRTEEGSTVLILTEQTMTPLSNGDHVVTTMFHQNSDVGLDTVINDVGSSSFVFRFGDGETDGNRINIGGDGVLGSVTFDDTNIKEAPITTITANTEEIETRAKNLQNATGTEIIAAFETRQQGGFGGKTATFAVSAKSLDLDLKNGTAVYIAVYDAKTDKTYQNKGEVKDGMIIFKTRHSGVFMIALEEF